MSRRTKNRALKKKGCGSAAMGAPFDGARQTKSKKVFIVHGRNHAVRDSIALFLTNDLGLKISIMEAGMHGGRTLPEKFEEIASQCAFAVFLLTADDDLVYAAKKKRIKRARQNVILEIGYFWGALGRRGRLAFLVEERPDMELPSDIQGIGSIPITSDLYETKVKLQNELKAAGLLQPDHVLGQSF